jgi:hypothetical protein
VCRDDNPWLQRSEFAQGLDPRHALVVVGVAQTHMHAIVSDIPGNNRRKLWDVYQ